MLRPLGLVPDAAVGHAELAALEVCPGDLVRDADRGWEEVSLSIPGHQQLGEVHVVAVAAEGVLAGAEVGPGCTARAPGRTDEHLDPPGQDRERAVAES